VTAVAATPWAWNPHPVLLVAVAFVGIGVALLHRRLSASAEHPLPWPRNRMLRFVGSLVLTVIVMGWPLGDLAAHWSVAVLVLQRCVLVLGVASLLLAGFPDDVLAWATRPAPVDAVLLRLVRPPVAVAVVTVLLVGSMVPALVTAQSNSAVVRALMALVILFAGIVLWLPVLGRVPGIPRPRPMIRAVYVVAQAVVPVFLSFLYILSRHPIYPTLSRPSDGIGVSPVTDQQIAGFVSKLTFLITLLSVAAAILVNAPDSDEDLGPEDPLVWADVQRHFERADRRSIVVPDVPGTAPLPVTDGDTPGTVDPPVGPQGPADDADHDQGQDRKADPPAE
jgi:cytochrome c oxidase assembly factor CtaG